MGYEILYKRFLVMDKNGELTPYIIHGSNNVTYGFSFNGKCKREHNITNLFTSFSGIKTSDLHYFLSVVYDRLKPDIDSGYFTRIPITKKGFINGFYKKIISLNDFNHYTNNGKNKDGESLDYFLDIKTRNKDFIDFESIKHNIILF